MAKKVKTLADDPLMGNSGRLIVTYEDTNVYSSTYGSQRTEYQEDSATCPLPNLEPEWELQSQACEQTSAGHNTGYLISTYEDVNPYSSTYGQTTTSSEWKGDAGEECEAWTTDPIWELESEACELVTYEPSGTQGFDGKKIYTYKDVNEESESYGETRTETLDSEDCPAPDTDPVWEDISEGECTQITYQPSGVSGNDGTRTKQQTDSNVYSSTFGSTQTVVVEDSENCPAPSTEPNWVQVGEGECEQIEY